MRADATVETLAQMKPVFKKENGTVTAGNASGINDAGAAVVLAEAKRSRRWASSRWRAWSATLTPASILLYMGVGPMPATRLVLQKTGLRIDDLDVIESNEAFAAQACAVIKELGFDPAKVNPNGSGISLGHPVGATGAIITIKAIVRIAPHRRPLCAGHDVHRRRAGHRGDFRADLRTVAASARPDAFWKISARGAQQE